MTTATARPEAVEEPGYLTPAQVSSLVQLSPRAIRERVRQGRFPKPARLGKTIRWQRESVYAFLADAAKGAE